MVQGNMIEFKGTKQGILICIQSQHESTAIKENLIDKIEKAQSFFKGAQIFDIQCDSLTFEEKEELGLLMRNEFNIHVLSPEERNNLIEADAPKEQIFSGIIEGATKFIQGTVRSGQNIDYEGNIVVLGDVNPGAQITAYGNIVVMGCLRGVAHAGSNGNIESFVAAFYLDPTQLRIGDFITRAPDGDYEKPKVPEVARVKDQMIFIEPYLNKK